MINLKDDILEALRTDGVLLSLLGGPYVWQLVAGDANQFPRITFFELDNVDSEYADDQATASRLYFQIDLWGKRPRDDIANEVDRILKSIGLSRTSSTDLYEADTAVCHKAMRYKTAKQL